MLVVFISAETVLIQSRVAPALYGKSLNKRSIIASQKVSDSVNFVVFHKEFFGELDVNFTSFSA